MIIWLAVLDVQSNYLRTNLPRGRGMTTKTLISRSWHASWAYWDPWETLKE
jgi:hypothetical protein